MLSKKQKVGLARLGGLATLLEKGKLIHKKFDFSTLNSDDADMKHQSGCGTRGCAIGELPGLDKAKWYFSNNNVGIIPLLRKGSSTSPIADASRYFAIPFSAAEHLFLPKGSIPYQNVELYGGKVLRKSATAKQVARNIRIFIDKATKNPSILKALY